MIISLFSGTGSKVLNELDALRHVLHQLRGEVLVFDRHNPSPFPLVQLLEQRAGLAVPESALALPFPMISDAETLARHWLEAAQQVLQALNAGHDVGFLVEGDASTYATFGHLARTVTALDAGVRIETIAGVSSYQAAAARFSLPLAEVDESIAIFPATYGVAAIEEMLERFDTLVLLKVSPVLDEVINLLDRRGLLAAARFIEKAGAPEERVVHDVARLRGTKVNYLSLMLVRNKA